MNHSSRSHDQIASDYDRYGDFEWVSEDVPAIAADLLTQRLHASAILADVGCGTGRYSVALRRRGLRVLSMDLSLPMLASIPREANRGRVQADAHRLPLAAGCLEAALAVLLFQHVGDPLRVCSEFQRVLKPGGFLATWSYTGTRPSAALRCPVHERVEWIYREEWASAGGKPKVQGWSGKWAETELGGLFGQREIVDHPALQVDTRNSAGWLRRKFDHRFRAYFDYPDGAFEQFRRRVDQRLANELPAQWEHEVERGRYRYRLALFTDGKP